MPPSVKTCPMKWGNSGSKPERSPTIHLTSAAAVFSPSLHFFIEAIAPSRTAKATIPKAGKMLALTIWMFFAPHASALEFKILNQPQHPKPKTQNPEPKT